MLFIESYAITYRGIIVGSYIVERSSADIYYIWRCDYKGNKVRNVGSEVNRMEACNTARVYANIASM